MKRGGDATGPVLKSDASALERAVLLVTLIFVLIYVTFPFQNFDAFWHMANGREMLEQGRIINEDIFSFTALGVRFQNHEWLTQILLYLIYDSMGAAGLALFKVLMTLVISLLLYKSARTMGADPVVASLLVAAAVIAGINRYTIRPQLFSFAFIALMSLILYGTREDKLDRRYLYALPVIMVFWDIMHGGIYGLILLGAFVVGETTKKVLSRKVEFEHFKPPMGRYLGALWTAFSLTLFVAAINPYGFRTYDIFVNYLFPEDNMLVSANLEFMPTSLGQAHLFWALLALVWALTAVFYRRADITHVLVLIPFSYMAVRYNRVTAVFALVSVPVLAYYASIIAARLRGRGAFLEPLWRGGRYALLASMVLYISYIKFFYPGQPIAFGYELNTRIVPRAAVEFIKAVKPVGNMYNPGHMGGYIAYKLYPQRKIFMYNHHIVFRNIPKLIHSRGFLDELGINYAFVDNSTSSRLLFSSARWVTVFWDEAATLVVRDSGENRHIIERYGLRHYLPGIGAGTLGVLARDPKVRPVLVREIARILAFREDLWTADYLGRLAAGQGGQGGLGGPSGAIPMLEAALVPNGNSGPLWGALGLMYYRAKRPGEAEGAFRRALALEPALTAARVNLAYIAYDRGRFLQAEAGFKEAIKSDEKMADAYYGMALTHERLGRPGAARRDWEGYLRLVPGGRWAEKARERLKAIESRDGN